METVTLNPGDPSWTVPAGVRRVTISAWHGGGSGGYGLGNGDGTATTGAGGAGAASVRVVNAPVTPGEVISLSIGVGGDPAGLIDGQDTTVNALAFSMSVVAGANAGKGYSNGAALAFSDYVWVAVDGVAYALSWGGSYYYNQFDVPEGVVQVYGDVAIFVSGTGYGGDTSGLGGNQVIHVTKNSDASQWAAGCTVNAAGIVVSIDTGWVDLNGGATALASTYSTGFFPGGTCHPGSSSATGVSYTTFTGQSGDDSVLNDTHGEDTGGLPKPDGGNAANSTGDYNTGSPDGGRGGYYTMDGDWTLAGAASPGGGGQGGAVDNINSNPDQLETPGGGAGGQVIIMWDKPILGGGEPVPADALALEI